MKKCIAISGFVSLVSGIALMYIKMNIKFDIFMFVMYFINTPIYVILNSWEDRFDKIALISYIFVTLFILDGRFTEQYQTLMGLSFILGMIVGTLVKYMENRKGE